METVGLVVGVAGLAGLFTSCLEAVDKVQSYQTFGTDSHVLDTRFKVAKARFERWGTGVGIEQGRLLPNHHSLLDDKDTSTVVTDVLDIIIKAICDASNTSLRRTRTAGPGDDQGTHRPRHPAPESRRRKMAWALRGKGGRTEQVELFEKLVEELHHLVPPDTGEHTRTETTPGHGWPLEIRRILARMEGEIRAETRRELHSWLGCSSPNERYHDSLQKRLTGTCNWILDRPVFQHWLATEVSAGPKLLWIHGPAGFGKTILCARVVEHLSSILETPVAHFFFSSDLESRGDPFFALRSWISQIVSRHEDAFEHVRQRCESDSDAVATRATVVTLFTQLLRVIPGCTFVADGLDECIYSDHSTTSITRFLQHVMDAVAGTDTRVLIASRDEPEIRHALIDDARETFAEYKILPDDVRPDNAACSQDIVNRTLPNKNDDLRSTLSKAMTDRCQGQFLWLKMQEESLNTPTGLDHVYDRNWMRITRFGERKKHRAFALLRWAAFALRPLTVCEITEAILIDESEDLLLEDLPDAVDDDYVDSEIVGLCGPLLEVRNESTAPSAGRQTVHLPHFSVRQYLLCKLPTPDWIQQNDRLQTSHEQLQNTVLAKACLQYIGLHQVWVDVPHGSSLTLGVSFRSYAATTWHQHINSGLRNNAELTRLSVGFLSRDNSTWGAWTALVESEDAKRQDEKAETIPPSPLYYAIKLHLTDVAISLITEQNINETSSLGRSALGIACSTGSINIVNVLLEKGANIAVASENGWTPLNMASSNGHVEVVKLLLEKGANTAVADNNGWTPLHAASIHGHVEVVKLLLKKGANTAVASENGWTPLNMASSNGHVEVVKLLLEKGADTAVADNNGWTPLNTASSNGHVEVVKLLLKKGADTAVADNDGWTPLYTASIYGHVKVVKLLLEKGADITVADNDGWTPLYAASSNGYAEVVKLLLEKGANIIVADNAGWTPLYTASIQGHAEVVKLLHEKGANATVANNDGWTPLNAASRNGHVEVVKLLIGIPSVDASKTDPLGRTALFLASRYGQHQVVQVLLSDGRINPGIRDWYGSTSLFAAVANGHFEVVELLVTEGTTIENQGGVGRSLIWWARRTGKPQLLSLLVQHTERVGGPIPDDATPNDAISASFDPEAAWCDACTLGIRDGCGYSCSLCGSGSFCLCSECFERGVRCCDSSHVLVLL
ncbi:hypothetical protein QQZ08_007008 [Neonectria magnoliae]|uniref:Prion-inhibition and propagation HeLo domain-containing protein n=1 Tax=Neonectria magnoliae TaxID=2732573 RepID=A0ABR1HZ92_9HYPO